MSSPYVLDEPDLEGDLGTVDLDVHAAQPAGQLPGGTQCAGGSDAVRPCDDHTGNGEYHGERQDERPEQEQRQPEPEAAAAVAVAAQPHRGQAGDHGRPSSSRIASGALI